MEAAPMYMIRRYAAADNKGEKKMFKISRLPVMRAERAASMERSISRC